MDKFTIALLNSQGCELDCRTVNSEEEFNDAVKDIALNCVLNVGDKIVIFENC